LKGEGVGGSHWFLLEDWDQLFVPIRGKKAVEAMGVKKEGG